MIRVFNTEFDPSNIRDVRVIERGGSEHILLQVEQEEGAVMFVRGPREEIYQAARQLRMMVGNCPGCME